jgi:hypothetical protein
MKQVGASASGGKRHMWSYRNCRELYLEKGIGIVPVKVKEVRIKKCSINLRTLKNG